MSHLRSTLWVACQVFLIAVTSIALVGAVTVVGGRVAARDALDFTFPPRPSGSDFAVVVTNNLVLVGMVLLAATKPCRRLDAVIALGSAVNLGLAGVALGGYGIRLLEHAAVYATCELASFSVALAAYINARTRRQFPTVGDAIVVAVLVLVSAALETVAALHL